MNRAFKTLSLITISLTLLLGNSQSYSAKTDSKQPAIEKIGEIKNKHITEASGIAISRIQKNVFWLLNDSGHDNVLYAVNAKGKLIGQVKVKGVKNKDWEDIASFEHQGQPYLLIADVGDNKAKRKKVKIHIIKEPKAKHLSTDSSYKVKPEWSIKFSYEDDPRDVESVAVDIQNNKIYLLSKRAKPPAIYEIPLQKKPKKQQAVAKKVHDMNLSHEPAVQDVMGLKYASFLSKPTAMDISADGQSAIVMTYTHAYYFQQNKLNSRKTIFENKPQAFALPYLEQGEAICFDETGQYIFVTSEGSPAPLFKINLQKRLAN